MVGSGTQNAPVDAGLPKSGAGNRGGRALIRRSSRLSTPPCPEESPRDGSHAPRLKRAQHLPGTPGASAPPRRPSS
eukprot:11163145-Lingulodinium_polyedra.AAC.1